MKQFPAEFGVSQKAISRILHHGREITSSSAPAPDESSRKKENGKTKENDQSKIKSR